MVLLSIVAVVGSNVLLKQLKLAGVESGTSNCASKEGNSSADIVLKYSQADVGLFTTGLTVKTSAERGKFIIELST